MPLAYYGPTSAANSTSHKMASRLAGFAASSLGAKLPFLLRCHDSDEKNTGSQLPVGSRNMCLVFYLL